MSQVSTIETLDNKYRALSQREKILALVVAVVFSGYITYELLVFPIAKEIDTLAMTVNTSYSQLNNQDAVTDFSQFSLPDVTNFNLRAQMLIDGASFKSNSVNVEFTPAGIQLSHDIVDDHVAGLPFTFMIKGYGYNNIDLPSYNPDKLAVYATRVAPVGGPAYGTFTFGQGYAVSSDPLFNLSVPSIPYMALSCALRMVNILMIKRYFQI